MEYKKIEISYIGDDGFIKMLEHIASTGALGHSFSIIVDPDDKEHSKRFGFDGDGLDRMQYIKIDGKTIYGHPQDRNNDIQKSLDDNFNAQKDWVNKNFLD